MEVFTMIAIIVVASVGAGVANNYFKLKSQQGELSDEDLASHEDELNALRERVEVLEKIVTDDKYQLSSQINALEENGRDDR